MPAIRILHDIDDLWALQPHWDALWSRCRGGHAQSYAANRAAWTEILGCASAKPIAVVAVAGADVVGLWTGVVQRRSAWRFLRPMGPSAADVADLLLDPEMPTSVASEMWTAVATDRHADIASVPYVRGGGPLESALTSDRRAVRVASHAAPYVLWDGAESWDTYYRSLSGHYRKLQRQKRKRLEQHGTVLIELTDDPSSVERLIEWIVMQKRGWSQHTGKCGPWLSSDRYIKYLQKLRYFQNTSQSFAAMTLKSADKLVAALFFHVSGETIETMILGFDPTYGQCSPGLLLGESSLIHSWRNGLRVGLGVGLEGNKQVWSRGAATRVDSFRAALSTWGRVGCGGQIALNGLRHLPLTERHMQTGAEAAHA